MSAWFAKQRREWIVEMVQVYGFINRSHVMKKFDVSVAQASTDLRHVLKNCPNLMAYNAVKKTYALLNTEEKRTLNDVPTDTRH